MSDRFNDQRLPTRYWNKVQPCPTTGCWLWTAGTAEGYGRFTLGRRKVPAHRLIYQVLVAPIPDGLEIDHKCRVRCCVNPDHLEPVTHRENVLRGVAPAADLAKRTHCKNGHLLLANVRMERRHRRCRVCKREYDKALYASRRKVS